MVSYLSPRNMERLKAKIIDQQPYKYNIWDNGGSIFIFEDGMGFIINNEQLAEIMEVIKNVND